MLVTGEQVKAAVIAAGITSIDHHECSLCGAMVRYYVYSGQLYFDSSCRCAESPARLESWDDPAEWISMQTDEEFAKKLAARFGIHADIVNNPDTANYASIKAQSDHT